MSRKKKAIVTPATSAEVDSLMGEYAQTDAKIETITATMDEEIAKIREKHSEELNQLNEKRENVFNRLQLWAEQGKEELFAKKKSKDLVHGILGFRIGTPKLKTKKGFTWPAALTLLKKVAGGDRYVRTKEELAKELLIADRKAPETIAIMQEAQIEVVQDETFYIDLKKEEASEAAA
jgi:phage host-nuclease inhibitor protein Gam